jgi:3-oxoacyl-[acyl-carrier protein] reductase
MELGLAGKIALVTGSSRGIGLATARALGREGARVMLSGRTQDTLDSARTSLESEGIEAHAFQVDLTNLEGPDRLVEHTVTTLGGLDVLVNNAGGSLGSGSFDAVDEARWSAVLALNLDAAVRCSRRAVAWMKTNGGGTIVHVTSVYGREYGPSAAYVAAKGALIALGKEMAVDLAKHGIRVNTIAPGSILFDGGSWARRRKQNPEAVAEMMRRELPFGRFGTPEEVADVITFVCSPRASWLAGISLPVDGAQGRAL